VETVRWRSNNDSTSREEARLRNIGLLGLRLGVAEFAVEASQLLGALAHTAL